MEVEINVEEEKKIRDLRRADRQCPTHYRMTSSHQSPGNEEVTGARSVGGGKHGKGGPCWHTFLKADHLGVDGEDRRLIHILNRNGDSCCGLRRGQDATGQHAIIGDGVGADGEVSRGVSTDDAVDGVPVGTVGLIPVHYHFQFRGIVIDVGNADKSCGCVGQAKVQVAFHVSGLDNDGTKLGRLPSRRLKKETGKRLQAINASRKGPLNERKEGEARINVLIISETVQHRAGFSLVDSLAPGHTMPCQNVPIQGLWEMKTAW
ncbi:hypothetical protein FQN60_009570, partial [Etheostoma spectabile]